MYSDTCGRSRNTRMDQKRIPTKSVLKTFSVTRKKLRRMYSFNPVKKKEEGPS